MNTPLSCSMLGWMLLLGLTACEVDGQPAGPASPGTTGGATPSTGDTGGATPGGDTGGGTVATGRDSTTSEGAGLAVSPAPSLQWKRYAAFEADLSGALRLAKDELCKELGQADCIRDVHLSPLGGHDPFGSGLLQSSAEPLATTPTVVERIVLSACAKRVELDADASTAAEVFGALDLTADAPAPEAEATHAVVEQLYRRFLARDPDPEEATLVAGLAVDAQGAPVSAQDFAKGACFAVATTTEFLFF